MALPAHRRRTLSMLRTVAGSYICLAGALRPDLVMEDSEAAAGVLGDAEAAEAPDVAYRESKTAGTASLEVDGAGSVWLDAKTKARAELEPHLSLVELNASDTSEWIGTLGAGPGLASSLPFKLIDSLFKSGRQSKENIKGRGNLKQGGSGKAMDLVTCKVMTKEQMADSYKAGCPDVEVKGQLVYRTEVTENPGLYFVAEQGVQLRSIASDVNDEEEGSSSRTLPKNAVVQVKQVDTVMLPGKKDKPKVQATWGYIDDKVYGSGWVKLQDHTQKRRKRYLSKENWPYGTYTVLSQTGLSVIDNHGKKTDMLIPPGKEVEVLTIRLSVSGNRNKRYVLGEIESGWVKLSRVDTNVVYAKPKEEESITFSGEKTDQGTCKYELGCGREACAFSVKNASLKYMAGSVAKPIHRPRFMKEDSDNEVYFGQKLWTYLDNNIAERDIFGENFVHYYGYLRPQNSTCNFIVMENGGGRDLSKSMDQLQLTEDYTDRDKPRRPLSLLTAEALEADGAVERLTTQLDNIRDVMQGVFRGLLFLSKLQVIHRDLKADNIMLTKDANEKWLTKIFDWGHATDTSESFWQEVRRRGLQGDQLASIGLFNTEDAIRPPEGDLGSRFQEFPLWSLDMWQAGAIMIELINGVSLPKTVKGSDLQRAEQERAKVVGDTDAEKNFGVFCDARSSWSTAQRLKCKKIALRAAEVQKEGKIPEGWGPENFFCYYACDKNLCFDAFATCRHECESFLLKPLAAPIRSMSCGQTDPSAYATVVANASQSGGGGPMTVDSAQALIQYLQPGCLLPDPVQAAKHPELSMRLEHLNDLVRNMLTQEPLMRISPYVAYSHPAMQWQGLPQEQSAAEANKPTEETGNAEGSNNANAEANAKSTGQGEASASREASNEGAASSNPASVFAAAVGAGRTMVNFIKHGTQMGDELCSVPDMPDNHHQQRRSKSSSSFSLQERAALMQRLNFTNEQMVEALDKDEHVQLEMDGDERCYWEGSAPWCNPQKCRKGFEKKEESKGGDGHSCWSGKKWKCCKKDRSKRLSAEPGDEDEDAEEGNEEENLVAGVKPGDIDDAKCYWSGNAPFCNFHDCKKGYKAMDYSTRGDGASCWTGKKLECCQLTRQGLEREKEEWRKEKKRYGSCAQHPLIQRGGSFAECLASKEMFWTQNAEHAASCAAYHICETLCPGLMDRAHVPQQK
eukprot:TRINITY_DN35683_c0_g1_i1.p1 TRINITY_DN35683_c0_g1~~TRINITY_DN35683_c0_g1_i1.p1  ORF type:complete len:1192 (+),score=260.11 TRINITY_DN35683_c0_g1_i1:147-3722(+)